MERSPVAALSTAFPTPGPCSVCLPETGFIRAGCLVPAIVPIARSTLHKWVSEGRFPRPVKLGPATTAWRVEDVRAWIAARSGGES
jgi:predicted DNA-binding transcriptional regulator AlpA